MAKNNAYDKGVYVPGGEDKGTYKEADKDFELVVESYSDSIDSKGFPTDARINVVKKIKLRNFVITIQRRQK